MDTICFNSCIQRHVLEKQALANDNEKATDLYGLQLVMTQFRSGRNFFPMSSGLFCLLAFSLKCNFFCYSTHCCCCCCRCHCSKTPKAFPSTPLNDWMKISCSFIHTFSYLKFKIIGKNSKKNIFSRMTSTKKTPQNKVIIITRIFHVLFSK